MGSRVQSLGVWDLDFKVKGSGLRVERSGFTWPWMWGLEASRILKFYCFGIRIIAPTETL